MPSFFALLLEPVLAKFKGHPKHTKTIGTQIAEGDLAEVLEKSLKKWPDVTLGSYPQERSAAFRVIITLESVSEASVGAATAWLMDQLEGSAL